MNVEDPFFKLCLEPSFFNNVYLIGYILKLDHIFLTFKLIYKKKL